MTTILKRAGLVFCALLGPVSLSAYADDELEHRFKIKYDLEINVSPNSHSFGSRLYVPDGTIIPVELGEYHAEITLTGTSPGYYEVEGSVSKVAAGMEQAEHVARMTFSGEDGVPFWFDWRNTSMHIKFEIIASGDRR